MRERTAVLRAESERLRAEIENLREELANVPEHQVVSGSSLFSSILLSLIFPFYQISDVDRSFSSSQEEKTAVLEKLSSSLAEVIACNTQLNVDVEQLKGSLKTKNEGITSSFLAPSPSNPLYLFRRKSTTGTIRETYTIYARKRH